MSEQGFNWFAAIKYVTYSLLAVNVYLFLQEETLALQHTFADGYAFSDLIQAFSATIDTTAWVILLLLFELETSVLPDEVIKGRVRYGLHGIRVFCYLFIGYAFYGYLAEMLTMYDVQQLDVESACEYLGADWSVLVTIDEYALLSAENCAQLKGSIWQLSSFNVLADTGRLQAVRGLAWVDVLNSAAWILVVLVLEIDVRLQLRGGYTDHLTRINTIVKLVLYAILFGAAVYWWLNGDFLDFWDAFLWLFAFIFIELNVFDWQAENRAVSEAASS